MDKSTRIPIPENSLRGFGKRLKYHWNKRNGWKEQTFFIVLMLPALILLGGIILWPFLNVFRISMTNQHLLKQGVDFVGFKNFLTVLNNPEFWRAFRTTMIWTFGVVILGAIIGLWSALLLHRRLPLTTLARGLILFPYIVPTVVAVLVFRYLFNDLYGIVNQVLLAIGFKPYPWLSETKAAVTTLLLVGTWKFFPFYVIALLGRLQVIPEELYEAAKMDGANPLQTFRHITWPSILPVFLLTLLLRIIWTSNKFDIVYLMTGGGPGKATTILPILIYNKVFVEYRVGLASAMAVITFSFLIIVGAIYLFAESRLEDINESD